MPENPTISKITLPSGSTYDIKDAQAREDIEALQGIAAGGIQLVGKTTTAITDGATTSPITVNNASHNAVKGDLVFYGNKEFVWDGAKWLEFGDMGSLGALAYKDNASATYTPAGSVSQPTFTGTSLTSTGNFTPAGSVSVTPSTTNVNSITAVGTLPLWTATVANENLTISWDAGTLPTKGSNTSVVTGATASFWHSRQR